MDKKQSINFTKNKSTVENEAAQWTEAVAWDFQNKGVSRRRWRYEAMFSLTNAWRLSEVKKDTQHLTN